MKLGSSDVDNFKVGSGQVDKIMLGTSVVWEHITYGEEIFDTEGTHTLYSLV